MQSSIEKTTKTIWGKHTNIWNMLEKETESKTCNRKIYYYYYFFFIVKKYCKIMCIFKSLVGVYKWINKIWQLLLLEFLIKIKLKYLKKNNIQTDAIKKVLKF